MSMAIEKFTFVPLKADTDIKPFKCKDKDLNGFLMDDAKKYLIDMMATTYLVEDKGEGKTVAYFSLLNDRISYDPSNHLIWNRLNRLVSNPKRRKHYPAVKIGRLAVSEEYRGMGLGSDIIRLIKYMLTTESIAGCRFITVDAYPQAVGFYNKCGFKYFSGDERQDRTISLYYDLKRFLDETVRTHTPIK